MSQQINLLNPLLKKQPNYLSLLTMVQLIGFTFLGSMLFYGYAAYQARQLNMQFDEGTKRFEAERARMIILEAEFSPAQTNEALQGEILKVEKDLATQAELIEALKSGEGGNTVGYSEYMRAFSRQVVQGLWLTSFKITGDASEISMNGAALNPELLPVYIQRLSKEKIMQGKTFSTLQIQAGAGKWASSPSPQRYVEFTLYSIPDVKAKK